MTRVTLIDVDDPEEPEIAVQLSFDGHLVASRRIGETLYLITRHYPWTKGYQPYPADKIQQRENRRLLDAAPLSELLPGWRVDDGPREIDSLEIGGRGTESDALRDHHALTWLPADRERGRPARLALPVRLHEILPTPAPRPPWQHYPWTHTGLYLFDIHDGSGPAKRLPGIVERGRMVVESAANGDLHSYSPLGDRALIRGDGVHYLHGDYIWSADWGDPESMIGPQ